MPTRSEMDRPAILMTAIVGVVIVAGSIPFLPALYCKSPSATCSTAGPGQTIKFNVNWFTAPAGAAPVSGSGETGRLFANLTVLAKNTAALHLKVAAADCVDRYDNATFKQQPVPIKFTLTRKVADTSDLIPTDKTSFTCADVKAGLDILVPRFGHADLATVEAQDAANATRSLWGQAAAQNETATYQLAITWARPRGGVIVPPNIPVGGTGQTSFSLKLVLTAEEWQATITQAPKEAVGK